MGDARQWNRGESTGARIVVRIKHRAASHFYTTSASYDFRALVERDLTTSMCAGRAVGYELPVVQVNQKYGAKRFVFEDQ